MAKLRKPIVITVATHKGGLGKTLTVLELARQFSILGKKVMVLDADCQCSASRRLGYRDDGGITLGELLMMVASSGMIAEDLCRQAIKHGNFSGYDIDYIPASPLFESLASVADGCLGAIRTILKNPAFANYDIVLIDTKPNVNGPVKTALCACDYLIIPYGCADLESSKGFADTCATFYDVIKDQEEQGAILGVFLNRYDSRAVLSRSCEAALQNQCSDLLFRSKIKDMKSAVSDIFLGDISKNNEIDKGFAELTKEVLERIQELEEA